MFKDSRKEKLYADLFQSLDMLGIEKAEEAVFVSLSRGLAERLRTKIRAGKSLDADDLRSIFADLPPEFAAAVRKELLETITAGRELANPNRGPIDAAVRRAVAKQMLDEVDGATRGLPEKAGRS